MTIAHEGAAVMFGPGVDGYLGFSPLDGATVDDVAVDVEELPKVPVYAVYTEHLCFPVVCDVNLFSTPEETAWPFELQLADAASADEMVHVRGPFGAPHDLERAMAGTRVVDSGSVARLDRDLGGISSWAEHEYQYQDATWRQRLYATSVASRRRLGQTHHVVVTAQAPAERAEAVFALADRLVAGLGSND